MKHILYLFITTIALLSCNGQESTERRRTERRRSTFHSQKHRFEVRGCEFFYNDQKIELYTPKSNFIKLFGDDFDPDNPDYHRSAPIYISEKVRSWEQSDILDVYSLYVRLWHVEPSHRNYNKYKHKPTIGWGQYILIDGIPFGHDISIKELNHALQKAGKQGFSGSFAGSSGIKGRGHLECENFPQFFIIFDDNGELESFNYGQQHKPKHLR